MVSFYCHSVCFSSFTLSKIGFALLVTKNGLFRVTRCLIILPNYTPRTLPLSPVRNTPSLLDHKRQLDRRYLRLIFKKVYLLYTNIIQSIYRIHVYKYFFISVYLMYILHVKYKYLNELYK